MQWEKRCCRRVMACLLIALLGACTRIGSAGLIDDASSGQDSALAQKMLSSQAGPQYFLGNESWAECRARQWRLFLDGKGRFLLATRVLDALIESSDEQPDWATEIGHYVVSGDGQSLLLRGGGDSWLSLAIGADATLRWQTAADTEPRAVTLAQTAAFSLKPFRVLQQGHYRPGTDAASFQSCRFDQDLPVIADDTGKQLASQYFSARKGPAEVAFVDLQVSLWNDALDPALSWQVHRIDALTTEDRSCPPATADTPLLETQWILVQLAGRPAPPASDQAGPAWFSLQPGPQRVTGFGSCNRLIGRYQQNEADGTLRVERMATTRMACESGDSLEQGLIRALESARHWRIVGPILELRTEAGEPPQARFEAAVILNNEEDDAS